MTPLQTEMRRWAREPFIWGQSDCVLVCADWVRQCRGVDPAGSLRGAYTSLRELDRRFGWLFDPLAVLEPRLTDAGLVATEAPVVGDVGLVVQTIARGERGLPQGGVYLGNGIWAVKGIEGVGAHVPSDILRAWSVGYVG